MYACGGDAAPGPWVEAGDHRWREVHPDGSSSSTGFTSIAAPDAGVRFVYDVPEARRADNRVLSEGQGVAIGDVDGDGLADLFFAGFGGPSALYRNLGRWRFEDITASAGLELTDTLVRGAVLADLDGDDRADLILAVHGGPNRLFLGDGAGGFSEAPDAGFSDAYASTTPTLSDIDGDGDLDLYVANYKTAQVDDLYSPEVLDLNRVQLGADGELAIPAGAEALYAQHYRLEFDGRFVRRFELGEPDELYLNEGGGRFRQVTLEDVLRRDETSGVADVDRDWGLTARFVDWDSDGDPDLYVTNDFTSPDGIWINRGDGTFDPAPPESFRTTSLSSMAVEAGDFDRDGDIDLITTDMLPLAATARLQQAKPNFEPSPEPPGVTNTRIQVNRNTVQLNRGDGTFAESAWHLGLAASDWTWGALVLDADLDGWEDLLVTTGHVWDQLDGDANARVSRMGGLPANQALAMFPELRQPNAAFRGGPSGFEDVGVSWGWAEAADISHGIAAGDLDADGDLDVVVTRLGDPPVLYRNDAVAPRVLVRLRGSPTNKDGIGARVRLSGHAVGDQIDEIVAGGLYLSSSEPAVSFAAASDRGLTLSVLWPGGEVSVVENVVPDREYEIWFEGARAGETPTTREVATHFVDVSAMLDHSHVESPFDDRTRQPLLSRSLSRLGPGVSWFDIDGDDDPDLILGSGRGGSPVLLRNDGSTLFPARALAPALSADATTLLPHPRENGTWDLVIGLSAYEATTLQEASQTPAAISVRLGRGAAAGRSRTLDASLAEPARGRAPARFPSATGPLAQADTDGDGDLDVFIGGRVVPGLYPVAASSRFLTNDNGQLRPDAQGSVPFADLGLVSGALFTDFDVDGDPDLVVAVEWGPVRVFRNEDGRFVDATSSLGLGSYSGRWNGVAAGDFNADGRPDLVATGWGTNIETSLPSAVFWGDYNLDGTLDVVEGTRGPDGWVPALRKDALAQPSAGPGLAALDRITYAVFARSTLERLVGRLDTATRLEAHELRHTVFMNLPDGFEAAPLPREAQMAPAFGVAVGDLDGDGFEDLVLAQNFFAGREGAPRYDAGRSLWLRGIGDGRFEPVSGVASGIRIYGDARGLALADYDLDRRVDIAVGVNGAATRLFHNQGGAPGLRVILEGPPENPQGIGAVLRLEYADGSLGPAREVRSGGGYWSRDEATQTLGMMAAPVSLHVRWPGGAQTVVEIADGLNELRIPSPR